MSFCTLSSFANHYSKRGRFHFAQIGHYHIALTPALTLSCHDGNIWLVKMKLPANQESGD
jgi:hypothetical protein